MLNLIFPLYYFLLFNVDYGECVSGFITTQIGPKALWNDTHLDRLKKDLLVNYDKFARPEEYDSNATITRISLSILHLETNEAKSTMEIQCLLKLKWNDSKLQWNPNDYGELGTVRIAEHEVWIPDIYLYNAAIGGEPFPRFGNRNVLVYSNGAVLWVPTVKYLVLCTFDLRYWPFDVQHCTIKLGSWVHSGNEIKLELDNKESAIDMSTVFSLAPEWEVEFTSEIVIKLYACCKEEYPAAIFNVTLTRKSTPYYYIVVAPAVVTTLLILFQFWLPSSAREKIILNGITAVILNIFLLYFNHRLAMTGTTPLIVVFYTFSLYIVGFSTIITIINFILGNLKNGRPLSYLITILMHDRVKKWMLLQDYSLKLTELNRTQNKQKEEDQDEILEVEENVPNLTYLIELEWQIITASIDRLSFIFTFVFFLILAIIVIV